MVGVQTILKCSGRTGSRQDPSGIHVWKAQAMRNNLRTLYVNIIGILFMIIVRNMLCFCFHVIFNFHKFSMSILSYFAQIDIKNQ